MKILKNPQKPQGSTIIGYIFDGYRIDLPYGEELLVTKDDVAMACKETFPFLSIEDVKTKDTTPKIKKEDVKKDEELDSILGIGPASKEKLLKFGIISPKQFFDTQKSDPALIKKIIGPVVYIKLFGNDEQKKEEKQAQPELNSL